MFIKGLMFSLLGYAKHPARTAFLEEKAVAGQRAFKTGGNKKQAVYEKKPGSDTPYLPAKESNLPVD
jgi:hypothetical protein